MENGQLGFRTVVADDTVHCQLSIVNFHFYLYYTTNLEKIKGFYIANQKEMIYNVLELL